MPWIEVSLWKWMDNDSLLCLQTLFIFEPGTTAQYEALLSSPCRLLNCHYRWCTTTAKTHRSRSSENSWGATAAGLSERYLTSFNLWVTGWGVRGQRSRSQHRWLRCMWSTEWERSFHTFVHNRRVNHGDKPTERTFFSFFLTCGKKNTDKEAQQDRIKKDLRYGSRTRP